MSSAQQLRSMSRPEVLLPSLLALSMICSACGADSPTPSDPKTSGSSVVESAGLALTPTAPPGMTAPEAPPELQFVAGYVLGGDSKATAMESTLRLHTYLALRDVHPGGVSLDWAPADTWDASMGREELQCRPKARKPAQRKASGLSPLAPTVRAATRPDPLGRSVPPPWTVRLGVRDHGEEVQVEAVLCPDEGARSQQVLFTQHGKEGPVIGELATWLASQVQVKDPGIFTDRWARPPTATASEAFAYSDSLLRAQEGTPAQRAEVLSEAALHYAPVAWLMAWVGPEGNRREAALAQAVALEEEFTAGIEDLASHHLRAGRLGDAVAALSRLVPPPDRRRPVEMFLATELLDEGLFEAAGAALDPLPDSWARSAPARRLAARIAVGAGNGTDGLEHTEAWLMIDPESTEAMLLQASALGQLERWDEAAELWEAVATGDAALRVPATRRWLVSTHNRGRAGEVAGFLTSLQDSRKLPLSTELQEFAAFDALVAGHAIDAQSRYGKLAAERPGVLRFAFNHCLAALGRGTARPDQGPCSPAPGNKLESTRIRAALISQSAGALPGAAPDPGAVLDEALALAPRAQALLKAKNDAAVSRAAPRDPGQH